MSTLVVRHTGTPDPLLPDAPRKLLTDHLTIPPSHMWDVSKLAALDGDMALSVPDSIGTVHATTASGGGKVKEVGSALLTKSMRFDKSAGASLVTTNGLTGVQTIFFIAKPMAGDTFDSTGPAALFAVNSGTVVAQGIGQGDADVAGVYTSNAATPADYTMPAVRGKWHLYSLVKPIVGTACRYGVDGAHAGYTAPQAGGLATLSILIAYARRRKGEFTLALGFDTAMTDAQVDAQYALLKTYFYDLDWA